MNCECHSLVYRALVTYSNSSTGEILVKIPSITGIDSVIPISYIGRSSITGVWSVPDINDQIIVSADDHNLSNVFWLRTDMPLSATVTTPVVTYKVGDTGPGGGVIFFVDRFDEYADFTYLEVAPVSAHVTRTWATGANQTTAVSGADSKALGAGHQNTLDIVAQAGNVDATCAAVYCADLTLDGQSDWYLPSLSEMRKIYAVVHLDLGVAGFDSVGTYWTSSELAGPQVWVFGFQFGIPQGQNKSTVYRVCPVRRF